MADIAQLEPKLVWQFFAGIAAVPRPSKHEEQIRAHLREVAAKHGLTAREDEVGNIVIDVPASPGCENAPTVVLQGHVDMVPEKNSGTQHDFEKDPIRTKITKDEKTGADIVVAEGTTLGADNGIGVALALAAATDPDVKHGPLQLLNTVDEEAGMTGAKALTPEFFKGDIFVNLDSEEDNAIYIGCAGGTDTNITWKLPLTACDGNCEPTRITVSGLRGGHSGGDIHENRGNANKVLTRVLHAGPTGMKLAAINGGSKRNAIPREASAVVCGPAGLQAALQAAAAEVQKQVAEESGEPGLKIAVESAKGDCDGTISPEDTRRVVAGLAALPSGVLGMHPKMPDLVQTSTNFGIITSEIAGKALKIDVCMLSRSSSLSLLHVVRDQLEAIAGLAGAEAVSGNEYPGWEPNPDSPTLAVCQRVYRELFGDDPHVAAIHAGLECGIINERVGGRLDTVSFGPTITGAHSPDERVYIDSVGKIWTYLKAVLAELAKS